jgi:hypothetical protein
MVVKEPGLVSKVSNWVLGYPHFILSVDGDAEMDSLESAFYSQWKESSLKGKGVIPRCIDCVRVLYRTVLREKLEELPTRLFQWADFEKELDQPQVTFSSLVKSSFFARSNLLDVLTILKDYKKLPSPKKKDSFEALAFKLQKLPESTLQRQILPYMLTTDMFAESAAISLYADLFGGRIVSLSGEGTTIRLESFLHELYRIKQFPIRYHLLLLAPHCEGIIRSVESMSQIFAEVKFE